MPNTPLDRAAVAVTVKRTLLVESRSPLGPDDVPDNEPLNGNLLQVSSLGFLGVLLRLEDELAVSLPDDLFTGRTFHVVDDVVDVVMRGAA
jgi:acyl carrier protein